MKVKKKLLLILLIPLVGMLFFSFTILKQKKEILNEMSQIEDLIQLSVNISLLIHETQKERGRTAGYLGSNGQAFVEEIKKQREITDKNIEGLKNLMTDFDVNQFEVTFIELIKDAFTRLDQLKNYRERITSLNISVDEAISYYTQMNAVFLDIIGYSSKLSKNTQLSTTISSYTQFLHSKERSGIERAVLSNTFAADKFNPGMYNKLISLITAQDLYISNFLKTSTSDNKSYYNEMISHKAINEVLRLRKIAIENSIEGEFGVEANYWFDTITQKIDQLKKLTIT